MLREMPDEAAEDGCNAEGIFETRASVGNPQFDRRIPQRGPDRPPDIASVAIACLRRRLRMRKLISMESSMHRKRIETIKMLLCSYMISLITFPKSAQPKPDPHRLTRFGYQISGLRMLWKVKGLGDRGG